MSNIIIRTNTIKSLNLRQDSTLNRLIIEACVNLCYSDYSEAFRILFKLLYGDAKERESQLNIYGITYNPEAETNNTEASLYVFHTESQVQTFGNELRYQYTKANPNFLKVSENSEYKKELDELKKNMSNVPMLLYIAVTSCDKIHENRNHVEFCYEMMTSSEEKNVFSGLKNMGHNSKHAELLKPYAKKMAALLMAMSNAYEQNQFCLFVEKAHAEKFDATPFKGLSKLLEDNQYELPEECEPTVPASENASNSCIECVQHTEQTLDKVSQYIEKKELFQKYFKAESSTKWTILKELRNSGFDLNEILDKENLIQCFFASHTTMEATSNLLYQAQNHFELAYQNLCITSSNSIYQLFTARQTLDAIESVAEKAKTKYNELVNELSMV